MRNVLYILILTLFSSLILIAQDSSPFNYSIPNFQVSDSFDSLSNHSPSIAVDEDKNFGITWIEKSDGSSNICVKFYDSNGNKLRGKIKVTADTSNVNQKQPSIVKKMNSHYAICWSEEYKGGSDIYLQLFTYNGIAIDYNILVNDDSLSAWNRDPQIGMNSSGDFVIVWTYIHNGITDIAAQLFLNDGAKSGSNIIIIHEKEVKADYLSPHVYLNNNGDFIIVWIVEPYGSNEVYLCSQKYSAEGNKVGDKIIVNETTAIIPWYATPSISGDIFGNYVITWIDERNDLMGDIYLQRYSFEDKKTGANEKINDDNDAAFQRYPSISMKNEGEYIITWLDLRRDNAGIYGQRFDSFGGKIESNFKITRDISCNQNEFDVNLWDKRIYNAWGSQREDNTGSDIWVNALDWDNPTDVKETHFNKSLRISI